ncbi:hypothetical protein MASR2M15_04770 [Anaerolineales bacterium]
MGPGMFSIGNKGSGIKGEIKMGKNKEKALGVDAEIEIKVGFSLALNNLMIGLGLGIGLGVLIGVIDRVWLRKKDNKG